MDISVRRETQLFCGRTVEVARKHNGSVALRSKELLDKLAQDARLCDALLHAAVCRRLRGAIRIRAAALGREVSAATRE